MRNQAVTEINPLFLGQPFRLTEEQRINLEPFLRAAGQHGAVLIVCTENPKSRNWLEARPIALPLAERKGISRYLTKAIKSTKP